MPEKARSWLRFWSGSRLQDISEGGGTAGSRIVNVLPVVSMHPVEERALSPTNAILLNNSAGLQYPGVGVKALLGVGKVGLGRS